MREDFGTQTEKTFCMIVLFAKFGWIQPPLIREDRGAVSFAPDALRCSRRRGQSKRVEAGQKCRYFKNAVYFAF